MTGRQLQAALKALGLTQVGAAKFLGVEDRTVRHWLAGTRKVPDPVALFLQFLVSAEITPEEVMDAIAPSSDPGVPPIQ